MPALTDKTYSNAGHTAGKQAAAGAAGQSLPALPVSLKAEGEITAPAFIATTENSGRSQPFQLKEAIATRPNATGMPNQLKSGIESLSGFDMSDVKVHSAEPAQLQAHAYARGTDIHLAAGQEKHLPHEAWHVVQQKQGRVQPTAQMKGYAVNDDAGLEKESDTMGAKAMQLKAFSLPTISTVPDRAAIVQLETAKAKMGNETVSADRNAGAADTLAFLMPAAKKAPVHLTKGVKDSAIDAISAHPSITHDDLNAEAADAPNHHFTVTSGLMTAALVNSNIKQYLVRYGQANAIWGFNAVDTAELSQNKLTCNNIVTAFNSDLGIAAAANFDNLIFTFDPDGGGPTFDQVLEFHDQVKNTLFAIPNANARSEVPFTKLKYAEMRAVIVGAADALAAQWNNWTEGDEAAVTRNSFKIAGDKWTDLAKAANILNRIHAKAIKLSTDGAAVAPMLNDHFIDAHLGGPAAARTAVKANMAVHNAAKAAEFAADA